MYKTILITGGSGFIGREVVAKLLQLNYKLVLLTRNDSNILSGKNIYIEHYDTTTVGFSNVFEKYKIDVIMHMASNTQKNCNYIDSIDSNIKIPVGLVTAALKNKVKYFINIDTTFYHSEINSYSLSKRQFKEWLRTKEREMTIVNLKIDNIYGKGDGKARFIPMVISSLLNGVKDLNLTSGKQRRDFIYIDDFSSLIYKVVQNLNNYGNGFYEYSVGSGSQTSVKDLVLLIEKIVDLNKTKLNFGAVKYYLKNDSELYSKIDISRTIRDFNWNPVVTLRDGLEEVVAHYKKKNND